MAKSLEDARKELDKEFAQHRDRLKKIHKALDEVEAAGPEDDVEGKLKDLEDVVKEARTGGLVGGGAKGHSKALDEYTKAKEG